MLIRTARGDDFLVFFGQTLAEKELGGLTQQANPKTTGNIHQQKGPLTRAECLKQ